MDPDNSYDQVNKAVDAVKKSVKLDYDNQQYDGSGHNSADYGSGAPQGAAGGVPGTSKSG